jgi:hypothetical protein
MSYDLTLWYSKNRLSRKRAAADLARLCKGDFSGFEGREQINSFVQELTDTFSREDASPWQHPPEISPLHVSLSLKLDAEDAFHRILDLADKHGLVIYDQDDIVTHPSSLELPWWKFW